MPEFDQRPLERVSFGANKAIARQGNVPTYFGIPRKDHVDILVSPQTDERASLDQVMNEGVLVESLEESDTGRRLPDICWILRDGSWEQETRPAKAEQGGPYFWRIPAMTYSLTPQGNTIGAEGLTSVFGMGTGVSPPL